MASTPSQPSSPVDAENPLAKKSRLTVKKLEESQLYKDYEDAFHRVTGLPVGLRPMQSYENVLNRKSGSSPFCQLLGQINEGCAQCLRMQQKLEQAAGLQPKSLHCFAGLCDTAVPIRVGEKMIAFLQTGQILLHQPNKEEFSRITQKILSWGAQINLKSLEEAYFQTRVLNKEQYDAMIQLLSTFAEHLGTISNSIEIDESAADPEIVANAKHYIMDRFHEPMSLDDAAQAVNTSTRHFCKVFKKATGITFTDYLSRVRVEKAKNLLQNPNVRISEVAFDVGFESLSQFNRSFKRVTDMSPSTYRKKLSSAA